MGANPGHGGASGALAGELIGGTLVVTQHPGLRRLPVEGTVVDETLELFVLRVPGRRRFRRIPKAGLVGTILLEAGEIPLKGDDLRVRPEDRTKRLLAGGRSRHP